MCSCLSRGEAPSTPGFDDVFDVFEVVGDLVGGVTGPIEAAFLLSSSARLSASSTSGAIRLDRTFISCVSISCSVSILPFKNLFSIV